MLSKATKFSYVLGMLTTVFVYSSFQDYLGLDGYIEYLNNNWMDIPYWVSVILLVLVLAAQSTLNSNHKKSTRYILQNTKAIFDRYLIVHADLIDDGDILEYSAEDIKNRINFIVAAKVELVD